MRGTNWDFLHKYRATHTVVLPKTFKRSLMCKIIGVPLQAVGTKNLSYHLLNSCDVQFNSRELKETKAEPIEMATGDGSCDGKGL